MRHTLRLLMIFAALMAGGLIQTVWVHAADSSAEPFLGYTKFLRYHASYNVNADGTHVETHEWAEQILTQQGIAQANRASVSFSDRLETAEILEAYTLKKDGKRLDVPRTNFQEESNKGKGDASPMFSDIRTKTAAFPDVGVGDTVVFSYKVTQREATFPGNFSMIQSFSKFQVYDDVQVSLSAPGSLQMHVFNRGVEGGQPSSTGDRIQWHWTYRNQHVAAPEAGAVSPLDYGPLIVASTFKDYGALAAAYSTRAEKKAVVTAEIRKLAEELTRDAHTPREQAKALYDWVAINIQYANNRVGVGSVVPHEASVVLANRMGDCKDHATLLETLLAAKGIKSTAVLIDADPSYSLPPVPSAEVFDHVITYIPSLDLYTDSTSRMTAFGSLPFDDSDKPVVPTTDFVEIKHTPPIDYRNNRANTKTVLTIHPDGSADGETSTEARGLWSTEVRSLMAYLPPNMEDQMVRHTLERRGYVGNGSLSLENPLLLTDVYHYSAKYRISDLLNLPGPAGNYVQSPFSGEGAIGTFLDGLNEVRTVNYQCEGLTSKQEYTLNLPEDLNILAIPRNVDLNSDMFSYKATYQRSGNTITAVRELVDRTPGNSCSPADAAAQKLFAVGVKRDLRAQVLYEAKPGH